MLKPVRVEKRPAPAPLAPSTPPAQTTFQSVTLGTSDIKAENLVPAATHPASSLAAAPITIVFFDHTAKWSGGEISLFNLVTRLDSAKFRPVVVLFEPGVLQEKLQAAGVETRVIELGGGINNARKNALGVKGILTSRQIGHVFRHLFALRRVLRAENAQIAHCNSLKADLLGGIAARLAGVPTIWHLRDRIADDYLPRRTARAFRWLARRIPTRIIAVSSGTLATLQLPARDLKRGKARAILNGTPLENIVPGCPVFARDALLIGMVGRLAPWKGQHIFLEAAAKVREQFPHARFQIVGAALFAADQAYEAQLRAQCHDLGLDDAVEWLGFRSDVSHLVAQMDVLAHASTTGEPFGQVIIEGMAAGRPVVATNGGGVPEIVEADITGFLVPMNDAPALGEAIIKLCAEPETARKMGQAGRRRVQEHFDIRVTVENVQAVYDDLLKK